MTKAQGSQRQILYGEESTWGTATGTLTVGRFNTGSDLALNIETFESEEVRSDRQVTDLRHGPKRVEASLPAHLVYSDFDSFFEGLFGNSFSANTYSLTSTTVSFVDSGNLMVSEDGWGSLSQYDVIKIAGSTSNNGYAEISAVNGTTLTLAHIDLVDESAGDSVTVSGLDLLTNGTSDISFTIEDGYTDISQYLTYTGMKVNSLDLEVPPDGMVNVTFGFLGKTLATPSGSSGDGSPTAASTNSPFSGIDASSIAEGGSVLGDCLVSDISLSFANGGQHEYGLGSASACNISQGRFRVTGTCTLYFEDATYLNKFLNETESSLQFLLLDPDGNPFWCDLHRIKYTAGKPQPNGENSVMLPMDITALRDSNTGYTATIAR